MRLYIYVSFRKIIITITIFATHSLLLKFICVKATRLKVLYNIVVDIIELDVNAY